MMYYFGDYGWGWGWGMIFGMALFWILIIAGVISLVYWWSRQNGTDKDKQSSSAFKILEERYAKGEIDKQEFEEKRDVLLRS